ncbi:Oligosaccharyl transferase, STT3 subunit [Thermogladius calderae 1633]|uniref:dolichyl-phosphooligosaccharide-protein glycotransferase n=1 Tax=Thermogladius calderae (strain DSM 22663 / VKM B-2946 / 1633) TaxID=1184251 RepID=I3TG97_THEC1|nr:STT3 domain-containing protein [Thermogladius calderae]AFK51785.1 Oligosaccharyl transferase, STT3 subunit [Thermogladius calderae 1633]
MSELSYRLGKTVYRFKAEHEKEFKLLVYGLLALVIVLGVYIRALPGINFGLELYEADPFVVYWQAKYIYEHGLLSWYTLTPENPATHIFWYPWGRDFAHSEYPALPMWEALSYNLVKFTGVSFKDWCVVQPLIFTVFTILFVYLTAYELTRGSHLAGLLAAAFYAFVPAATGRSIIGFSTKYGIGIMFATLFFYLYVLFYKSYSARGLSTKTLVLLVLTSLALGLLGWSWGGFIYVLGGFVAYLLLLPLLSVKDATPRFVLLNIAILALTMVVVLGSPAITAMLQIIPFKLTGLGSLLLASTLIPLLFSLQFYEYKLLGLKRPLLKRAGYFLVLLLIVALGAALMYIGKLDIPGRFAWILGLRTIASNPIFESVEEHQPALAVMGISAILRSWGTYSDWLFFVSPFILAVMGALYLLYKGTADRVLVSVAFLLAVYAYMNAAYMEVTAATTGLTIAGVFAGVIASRLIPSEAVYARDKKRMYVKKTSPEVFYASLFLTLFMTANIALAGYNTYSQMNNVVPSIKAGYTSLPYWTDAWYKAIEVIRNTTPDSVIVAWWDYGYPISVLGQRPTVADGSTLNTTQIGILGLTLTAQNDSEVLRLLDLLQTPVNNTYILVFDVFNFRPSGNDSYVVTPVIPGLMVGLDDIPKSIWMIRIGDSIVGQLQSMGVNVSYRNLGDAFYLYLFQNNIVISPRFDDLSNAPLLYRLLVDGILYLNKQWNANVTFMWYTGIADSVSTLTAQYPQLSGVVEQLNLTTYIRVLSVKTLTYEQRPLANSPYFKPYAIIAEPFYDKNGNKVIINGAYLYEVITIYQVVYPSQA